MPASEDAAIVGGPWLAVLAALSAAPAARIGDVQFLEVAQVISLCAAAALAVHARFRVRLPAVWREYGGRYLALLCACAAVSALIQIQVPAEATPAKHLYYRLPVLAAFRSADPPARRQHPVTAKSSVMATEVDRRILLDCGL
jgi:hypothetical protein